MNKFIAILNDSVLEIRDRKIIYLYLAVTVVMVLVFALIPDSLKVNGQDLMESGIIDDSMITEVVARFFDGFFGFMMFLMVFGSAGLLPSYLGKGRVELVLSRPIGRFKLLSMKFIAVYLVMIAILAAVSTIIFLTMSLRLGGLSGDFFFGLLFASLQFLIVYAIVFFIGVISNSGAAAIMGYFIIRIGAGLLAGREVVYAFLGDSIWKTVLDAVYHIFPKIGEMSGNYISILSGRGFGDFYPVWSSLLFAAVLYLLTLLYFNRKDY
ncbi:MAG: hypothetical protein GY841_08140 [FCB group bacterium]|nr:hypothetical protein [FCB group bacterium]